MVNAVTDNIDSRKRKSEWVKMYIQLTLVEYVLENHLHNSSVLKSFALHTNVPKIFIKFTGNDQGKHMYA